MKYSIDYMLDIDCLRAAKSCELQGGKSKFLGERNLMKHFLKNPL